MIGNKKLERAIKRSQKAYELYLDDRLYYQALRIFRSNINVYNLLEEFLYECDEEHLDDVNAFIFHLDDWFNSFEVAQALNPGLEERFVFERLPNSPAFPSNFIDKVLNN